MEKKVNIPDLINRLGVKIEKKLSEKFEVDLLISGPGDDRWHMIFLAVKPVTTSAIYGVLVTSAHALGMHTSHESSKDRVHRSGCFFPVGPNKIGIHYAIFNDSRKGDSIYIRLSPDVE